MPGGRYCRRDLSYFAAFLAGFAGADFLAGAADFAGFLAGSGFAFAIYPPITPQGIISFTLDDLKLQLGSEAQLLLNYRFIIIGIKIFVT